jgi:flagellar hook-basal body complex protein FliE
VRRLLSLVLLALVASGCSQPPQKEIDQAQTALDAAKLAGAEKYAAEEYTAASSSLQKAHESVDQRDYRQALNYAIDSRQRSQEAAKLAAEAKVRARQDASQLITDVGVRFSQARMRLQTLDPSGASKDLRLPRGMLIEAESSLQDARAEIRAGNYDKVTELLTYVRGIVDQANRLLDNVPQKPGKKKSATG